MNYLTEKFFANKSPVDGELEKYSFVLRDGKYFYTAEILDGQMTLTVSIDGKGDIDTEVTDAATGDIYTLYLVEGATGSFVAEVRVACETALADIAAKCYRCEIYRENQTKAVVEYVRERYGDELEFLWNDDNAVWRRKDNNKWYGAILSVSRRKFGQNSDERAEVIDLRATPEEIDGLADGVKYFRGYHMNKKHWLTMILDGSVELEEVCRRIDESYLLAAKK